MKKKEIIISLIIIVLCAGGYFTVKYFLDKDLEKEKNKLQETIDKYGTVSEITVFDLVDKFNVELSNNEKNHYLDNELMIAENNTYWYRIYEDVISYVKPVKFTNDINKDIVDTMAIRYDVNSKNEDMVLEYVKYLIKVSNSEITDSEITKLMNEAKEKEPAKKMANNGKGISVGILKTDEIVEYQIVRLYK